MQRTFLVFGSCVLLVCSSAYVTGSGCIHLRLQCKLLICWTFPRFHVAASVFYLMLWQHCDSGLVRVRKRDLVTTKTDGNCSGLSTSAVSSYLTERVSTISSFDSRKPVKIKKSLFLWENTLCTFLQGGAQVSSLCCVCSPTLIWLFKCLEKSLA